MLDDSPVYHDSSRQMFPSGMSVASTARTDRSVTEAMAKDKIYRWITFRMKFNKDYLTDLFRAQGDSPPPSNLTGHSFVRGYLKDPNTQRLGTMLKEKYSAEGFGRLSGNLFFLFGLPRVRRINEEFYRAVDPDAENESIAESASQERRLYMGPSDGVMPAAHDQIQDESNIYAKSIKRPSVAQSKRESSFRRTGVEENDSSPKPVPKVHDRAQGSQKREAIYGDYIRSDFGATTADDTVPKVQDRGMRRGEKDAVYGDYIRSDFGATNTDDVAPKVQDRAQRNPERGAVYGDYIRPDLGATRQEPSYLGQSRNLRATKQEPSYLGQSRKEKADMQWQQIEKSTRNDPYNEQFFFKGIN